jgi:hypothetical protein
MHHALKEIITFSLRLSQILLYDNNCNYMLRLNTKKKMKRLYLFH